MFDFSKHIEETTEVIKRSYEHNGEIKFYSTRGIAPRLLCADGFSMSVQASKSHYCSPRNDYGPWFDFEVGYPSRREPLLEEYAEDKKRLTKTVYGWVPSYILQEVVEKHGGVVGIHTYKRRKKKVNAPVDK